MSSHQFDTEIARQVGVNAAVIFQHIVFWCEKNAANEVNLREGRYWTYNSMAAFQDLFPYLSFSQIRSALAKLEEAGLILSGEFNEDRWLRRKWYCVKSQMHLSNFANASAKNRNSYKDTDNRTQIVNTDSAPIAREADLSLFPEESDGSPQVEPSKAKNNRFEEFWQAYPKKVGKPAAERNFARAVKAGADPGQIIEGARRYAQSEAVQRGFVKHPQGWLSDERWNDDAAPVASSQAYRPSERWYEDQIER